MPDDSKQEKRKKKKKKKRNAAIVSIEEDESSRDVKVDVKDFPLNDSSVKKTSNSTSDSKSSSLGRTRSSSYPGNITVVTEGSEAKTSLVNGEAMVFAETTKSISLPDNSISEESIAERKLSKSKSSSFNLEDFLENVTVEPRYDTLGGSVQEAPTGEDTGNFVFGAADLFLRQPKVDQEKTNISQFQNTKETFSAIPPDTEVTGDPVQPIQRDCKVKETDLYQRKNDSWSERFETSFSSTTTLQYSKDGDENLSQGKQNLDSCRLYSLKEGGDNESNFSITQTQIPSSNEKSDTGHVTEASNESQDSNALNLSNRQISHVDAQEHQGYRDSPSQEERISDNEELYENTSNDFDDFEPAQSPESQSAANDGKVEPVVLLDSGESLVPVAEGDVTSKTGAQSTFYYAPDVSAENDRDSLSRSVRRVLKK